MLDDNGHAFEGDEAQTRSFLRNLRGGHYYTYLLLSPAGDPFYVGKGRGFRALEHVRKAMRQSGLPTTNPFKCSTIRRIHRCGGTVGYRIDRVYPETAQLACLQREEMLISTYRRRCDGGVLTNLAAGLGSLSAPDPFSAARHAATLGGVSEERPERTALNLFLRSLGGVDSVPIKPLSEYRNRLVGAYPSPKALKMPSRRNGLTIAAAALAQSLRLVGEVVVARAFSLQPDAENWPLKAPCPPLVDAVIENGAASDILKLGLCSLVPAPQPENECFRLDAAQSRAIVGLIGPRKAEEWDLI